MATRAGLFAEKLSEAFVQRIIIPHDRLSHEALQGLIEEFVTREGTDTGYTDGSLERNFEMVMRQLKRGDVVIVYDEATETANIVPKEDAISISEDED